MTTSAIYIETDAGRNVAGYAHIVAHIGFVNLDEMRAKFTYSDASSVPYGACKFAVSVRCQLGGGDDHGGSYAKPYAIRYVIDPRDYSDGVELGRMAGLAKVESKLQKALAKVADTIGQPESFEDHVLALFLATKPELVITAKGRDWTTPDTTQAATADKVRQLVRHALADVMTKLYPQRDADTA